MRVHEREAVGRILDAATAFDEPAVIHQRMLEALLVGAGVDFACLGDHFKMVAGRDDFGQWFSRRAPSETRRTEREMVTWLPENPMLPRAAQDMLNPTREGAMPAFVVPEDLLGQEWLRSGFHEKFVQPRDLQEIFCLAFPDANKQMRWGAIILTPRTRRYPRGRPQARRFLEWIRPHFARVLVHVDEWSRQRNVMRHFWEQTAVPVGVIVQRLGQSPRWEHLSAGLCRLGDADALNALAHVAAGAGPLHPGLLWRAGNGQTFRVSTMQAGTLGQPKTVLVRLAPLNTALTPQEFIERARASGLTARQAEMLYQMSLGKSNRGIGFALNVSEHTVHRHLANIFRTLNVGNRVEAIRAIQDRLS